MNRSVAQNLKDELADSNESKSGSTHVSDQIPQETRDLLKKFRKRIQHEVQQVVVGMESIVDRLLIALLAGGHVLLEGVPGTAKTTLAKSIADALNLSEHRIQFTPDLLPSDITGTFVFDNKENEFVLRKGPIFCQLLLADEINRAPAKTQSALLEAMQERQVTIEGETCKLPDPFLVIATQNPVEQEGVYRLPEAQLDRFLLRIEIGYPARDTELDILKLHGSHSGIGTVTVSQNQTKADPTDSMDHSNNGDGLEIDTNLIRSLQEKLGLVYAEPSVLDYIVDLSRVTRNHPEIMLGASPRASLNLLQATKAVALLDGRHYCTHKDVQSIFTSVMGHRLIMTPEAEVEGKSIQHSISDVFQQVPVLFDADKSK